MKSRKIIKHLSLVKGYLRDKNQQEAEQHFEKQAWVFESMKEESLNQP